MFNPLEESKYIEKFGLYDAAELQTLCNLVQLGVKPVATLNILNELVEETIEYIHLTYKLNTTIIKDPMLNCDTSVYFYKYPYYDEIIKTIYENNKFGFSNFYHWVMGKLFGYDDISILEFIQNDKRKEE